MKTGRPFIFFPLIQQMSESRLIWSLCSTGANWTIEMFPQADFSGANWCCVGSRVRRGRLSVLPQRWWSTRCWVVEREPALHSRIMYFNLGSIFFPPDLLFIFYFSRPLTLIDLTSVQSKRASCSKPYFGSGLAQFPSLILYPRRFFLRCRRLSRPISTVRRNEKCFQ